MPQSHKYQLPRAKKTLRFTKTFPQSVATNSSSVFLHNDDEDTADDDDTDDGGDVADLEEEDDAVSKRRSTSVPQLKDHHTTDLASAAVL